jgi:hypothetical protein
MPDYPRDLQGLIAHLLEQREFQTLANNLLAQWGPGGVLIGPNYLPPRFLEDPEGTITDVRIRTVAAKDGSRYSPAQKVGTGQLFGAIRYRLGNSDLLVEITGADYDALVKWLNQNLSMQAAARLLGLFNTKLVQALVEHDELKIWEAIQFNTVTLRGDNGFFSYEEGPDLTDHFVDLSAEPWTDPDVDPWVAIFEQVDKLVDLGFDRGGIRFVSTNRVMNALRRNPFTKDRAGRSVITTNESGQVNAVRLTGTLSLTDTSGIFESEGLQAPVVYDRRIVTETGEVRAYAEGHMSLIASTGMSEEVRFNQDNPEDVRVVNDVLGFLGISRPNGNPTPMRETFVRAYTEQKDKRVEAEGDQTTGPVILMPQARIEMSGMLEEAGS